MSVLEYTQIDKVGKSNESIVKVTSMSGNPGASSLKRNRTKEKQNSMPRLSAMRKT